jgi:2,3-bisphosphoglycerate-independent phosphoglycerate mutase
MIHQLSEHPTSQAPVVLVILDGFGLAEPGPGNAITRETAPNIFRYMQEYPSTTLKAHGDAVGLFPHQSGNSESGHFTIGSGRIIKQDLVYISDAITDGTFFKNTAFIEALRYATDHQSNIHILGLLTDHQSPHARPDHLYALLDYFRSHQFDRIYLHLFTDGRDAPPHSAVQYLQELRQHMRSNEKIASIMGRHYAMDRNKNWDRTEKAYRTLIEGVSMHTSKSAEEAIAAAYNRGETDEYIEPTIIVDESATPIATVRDSDVICFFNARSDRARQITKAFVQTEFEQKNPGTFTRSVVPARTRFVAMADFGPDLDHILTAFPSPDVPDCLAKAIGESRRQLFISETEKYAHVTFFLNGGYPEPINGEVRELVKSSDIHNFADKPEMHCREVTDRILAYIADNTYDFICVNYPNADMVGHTGNIDAAMTAVRAVDTCTSELVEAVRAKGGMVLITADHGNAECMRTSSGEMVTEHSTSPVPCILVSDDLKGRILRTDGGLQDIAPTLLSYMHIPVPSVMTGTTLLIDAL